jgi:hypothetical protein
VHTHSIKNLPGEAYGSAASDCNGIATRGEAAAGDEQEPSPSPLPPPAPSPYPVAAADEEDKENPSQPLFMSMPHARIELEGEEGPRESNQRVASNWYSSVVVLTCKQARGKPSPSQN